MGSWDVMSSHYIDIHSPPPGLSSFTRIRLGWISPDQVLFVNPGETSGTFLSPLDQGGANLVIKIPLPKSEYYLVENRQKIGFDRVQSDFGILILKVNPEAQEGSGTVRIMDAEPDSRNFSHATFRLDKGERKIFLDQHNNVAIIPLWLQGEKQGVLVTTTEKGSSALKATLMIREIWRQYPKYTGEQKKLIEKCLESFKKSEFQEACRLAQELL